MSWVTVARTFLVTGAAALGYLHGRQTVANRKLRKVEVEKSEHVVSLEKSNGL